MFRLIGVIFAALFTCLQSASAQAPSIQPTLQMHGQIIVKSSRKSIAPAIDAVAASGLPQAADVLRIWQQKDMWQRKEDGLFFRAEKLEGKTYALFDLDSGAAAGQAQKAALKQIKPNSGIRGLLATALVQFQLSDPDPAARLMALNSIERDPSAEALAPLRASIDGEANPEILAKKQRLERLLTISFDADEAARIAAIQQMSGDLGVDLRATLNPLVQTRIIATEGELPDDANVKAELIPGEEALGAPEAYALLVDAELAPPLLSGEAVKAVLADNIEGGRVAGIAIASLHTIENRTAAYGALVEAGLAEPGVTDVQIAEILTKYRFHEVFLEPSRAITSAATEALTDIEISVGAYQTVDLTLDALSLASIYFLAAIGLAITFGVMGVINMAHGEFIMMGAYTGYVVQQIIPDHTISILVALPLAFAVTFAAGVAMERLVIRFLYNRPLETLLATFGISIALQQLAKNIFGTQARPLTSPGWLDGAWVINDIVSISYIRIAIFVLALFFLGIFLLIINRTRLGLETRAVTQNRRMAASMGINPERVNMLTFGLGSGIAGIAGVAIGLYAKVTSEMGSDYIVQSFMTVVVGGVGNIWGTLLGATMIGFFQKGIEWFNPANTLAAQTYMIVFIIIFIQFRPRGIIALKGRAAGD